MRWGWIYLWGETRIIPRDKVTVVLLIATSHRYPATVTSLTYLFLTCLSGWKIVCLLSVYEALKRELL